MVIERLFNMKARLLVEGCQISPSLTIDDSTHAKAFHLYSHSKEKFATPIPDDVCFAEDTNILCRIRADKTSSLRLVKENDRFFIVDQTASSPPVPVNLIAKPKSSDKTIGNRTVHQICSFLGNDMVGVIPSNYCFYFKDGKECRFCEIWQNFKNEVSFDKSFKKIPLIKDALRLVLENDTHIRHIAITTGNITSYDASMQYFCQLGKELPSLPNFDRIHDTLATLMPPDNFSLIKELSETGFNKIYFPIEVFDQDLFSIICPGKNDYGYQRIIDALSYAVECFGVGNVYTNLVYGIQSLAHSLDPHSYDPIEENQRSLTAVDFFVQMGVIPAFTIYHYSGYNHIGKIQLDATSVISFFKEWGEKLHESGISQKEDTVIFGRGTLSNTLYNDGYYSAKITQRVEA